MSTRLLARLIFFFFTLLQNTVGAGIALRYFLDSVRDCHFDDTVSSNVNLMSGAVTEEIVTRSRWLVEFSVSSPFLGFKMAKIDPVSPFYSTL